jgi:hypothetical protein
MGREWDQIPRLAKQRLANAPKIEFFGQEARVCTRHSVEIVGPISSPNYLQCFLGVTEAAIEQQFVDFKLRVNDFFIDGRLLLCR